MAAKGKALCELFSKEALPRSTGGDYWEKRRSLSRRAPPSPPKMASVTAAATAAAPTARPSRRSLGAAGSSFAAEAVPVSLRRSARAAAAPVRIPARAGRAFDD